MSSSHPGPERPAELEHALHDALLESDRVAVGRLYREALAIMPPLECAEKLLGPLLNRIGDEWAAGEVALAQLYMCGRICEEQIGDLLPHEAPVRPDAPRLGIATLVDHHVLGKRIVLSVLRIAGYPVVDYGAGLEPQDLAAAARADDLDALLVSTLMLPSALRIAGLTEALRDHRMKVFVGGAPFRFDPDLWRCVGADGVGHDAGDALALVAGLEGVPR